MRLHLTRAHIVTLERTSGFGFSFRDQTRKPDMYLLPTTSSLRTKTRSDQPVWKRRIMQDWPTCCLAHAYVYPTFVPRGPVTATEARRPSGKRSCELETIDSFRGRRSPCKVRMQQYVHMKSRDDRIFCIATARSMKINDTNFVVRLAVTMLPTSSDTCHRRGVTLRRRFRCTATSIRLLPTTRARTTSKSSPAAIARC